MNGNCAFFAKLLLMMRPIEGKWRLKSTESKSEDRKTNDFCCVPCARLSEYTLYFRVFWRKFACAQPQHYHFPLVFHFCAFGIDCLRFNDWAFCAANEYLSSAYKLALFYTFISFCKCDYHFSWKWCIYKLNAESYWDFIY